jgi:hypothetical protein
MKARSRHIPRLAGTVTVTPIRDRFGENDDAFAVSWHSRTGDLCWLSPRIPDQGSADIAAAVLADFTRSVLAR